MSPRVVHVISNLGTGGAENMLLRLMENEAAASRAGDHTVISLLSGGALADRIRSLGVDLVELGASRSLRTTLLLPNLAGSLRKARPDLIQAWMYHGNVAASAARLFLRTRPPILWNIRQSVQKLANNSARTQAVILAGTAMRLSPHGIIYNSEVSAFQHEGLGYPRSKRIIIENGFEITPSRRDEARARLSQELRLEPDALLIGRVARRAAQKDDATLFSAFGRMAVENPKVHLILIGYGMTVDDPDLVLLARETGFSDRVHFLGERPDVGQLTNAFDLALSSSAHSEGFSNVIAEAMAAGVPTIATDVGDSAKIVGDRSRIVSPRDPDALAAAGLGILALPPDERKALGARDRQWISDHFDMRSIAARYRSLWDETASSE